MLGAVRGVFLALTVSLGLVSVGNNGSGSAPSTTTPKMITVIVYGEPLPTTTTTVPPAPQPRQSHPLGAYNPIDYDTVGKTLWQTWRTDPTAYKPSATDPIRTLPLDIQTRFLCIRYLESRNHPNDTNQQSGAEGLYQFLPYIWNYGAGHLGIHAPSANHATPEQQSAVAVWYYNRNHGFYPEWGNECTQ